MAPQNTNQRLNEIAARIDEHQERLDQHEARLSKYDVIIAKLEALLTSIITRIDIDEPLLHDTVKALAHLDEKTNSNRLWINVVISVILVLFGAALSLLGNYLVHLLH